VQNKHAFFKKIDSLPKGPEWTCEIFEITGDRKDENGDAIVEDVELWRRDPVAVVLNSFVIFLGEDLLVLNGFSPGLLNPYREGYFSHGMINQVFS